MSVTFTAGIDSITLPNPTLGNSQQDNMQSYFREAMNGKLRGYKRTPKVTTLNINFVGLCTPDYINMLNFFIATAGESMLYTDNDGVIWEGYITNQPLEFVDNGNQTIDARQRHSFPITFVVPPRLWTPANITTELWLDAADASTITQSLGDVSQWDDKSGNARHVAQGTGSYQPITNTRTINDLNALDFDANVLEQLTDASAIFPTGKDIFVFTVAELDAGTANFLFYASDITPAGIQSIDSDYNGYAGGDILEAHMGTAQANSNQYILLDDFLSSTKTDLALALSTPYLSAGQFDRTTPSSQRVQNWLNGVGLGFSGTNVGSGKTATTILIGSMGYIPAIPTRSLDGKLGEVIVAHDISIATRQLIEGYLAWKWRTQSSLPNGHPYKLAPPTGF